jgi:excisionase family DNA binding protein
MRKIKLNYSADVDAMVIGLVPDGRSVRSQRLAPDTIVDYDASGRLISIEILNMKHHYPETDVTDLGPPIITLTIAEASKESGLARDTLVKQIKNGRLKGIKKGRDWNVALHDLWNYLETRRPAGRPAKRRKARRPKVEA